MNPIKLLYPYNQKVDAAARHHGCRNKTKDSLQPEVMTKVMLRANMIG